MLVRIGIELRVRIFLLAEPSALEAEHKGQKAKHCTWYRGPARVMKRLSDTTYTVELCSIQQEAVRPTHYQRLGMWQYDAHKHPRPPNNKKGARKPIADTAHASTDAYDAGDYIGIKR